MADLYLAVDQGGHTSRAIVFDDGGRQVASASAPLATRHSDPGFVEHDPEELIGSINGAVSQACARVVRGGDRIAAAGLATQRSSIVCWNRRTGEALSPVISWQDRRNAQWLASLEDRKPWIRQHTGLVLSPHYGASKLRWCLDHLPAVQAAVAAGELAMGPLASFILYRLLPRRPYVVDPANASRTQLWDPATQRWSEPLCALFGIDSRTLPACVTSRHAFGALATPAGEVPVTVVTGDQSAVPFAFGSLDAATAYVNVGTGAFIQRPVPGSLPDAPRLLASVVWSDEAAVTFTLEGTVNGAGSALDWFGEREHGGVQELLDELTSRDLSALRPPIFLNAVSGLGSPFWVSDFESRFVGTGTRSERLLAVIESIVFLICVNLGELGPHGPRLRRILLTGGVSANEVFCRRLADAANLTILRSREPEATARGLARLVAGSADWTATMAVDTFEPQPDSALAARFDAWRAALGSAIRSGP